jgi:hypothetical protein
MAIDRGGSWCTGEDLGDLAEYLREYTADAYSADEARWVSVWAFGVAVTVGVVLLQVSRTRRRGGADQ